MTYYILFDCNSPVSYYREINGVGRLQVCLRDRATRITIEQVKKITDDFWVSKQVRLFFAPAK